MNFGRYGWGIILYTLVCMMSNGLIHTNGINVLVPMIETQQGWSSATLLAINSVAGIVGVFFSFVIGRMIVKWGCRKVASIALIAGGLIAASFGRVSSLVGFFVVMALLWCATDAFGQMVPFTLNANWFSVKKGRALGVSTAGYALGGIVTVPLLLAVIGAFGFADAFLFVGGFYILLGVITILFVHDRPEEVGAFVDNDPASSHAEAQIVAEKYIPVKTLLRDKNMWSIAVAMGFIWASTIGLVSQLVPSLMSVGLDRQTATHFLQAEAACGIVGSFAFGWIDDKIGTRKASMLMAFLYIVVFVVMATAVNNATALKFVVVVGGFGTGAICNLLPSSIVTVYGRAGFASANTLISPLAGILRCMNFAILALGLALGGSYQIAYGIFSVLCIVSFFLLYRTKAQA